MSMSNVSPQEQGMHLDQVPPDVLRLGLGLPRFADGRIDYTHAAEAPVLNCFVLHKGKLLLLLRSGEVGWMKNRWHIVAGFLDEERTLREKIIEELEEELGIAEHSIADMAVGEPWVD